MNAEVKRNFSTFRYLVTYLNHFGYRPLSFDTKKHTKRVAFEVLVCDFARYCFKNENLVRGAKFLLRAKVNQSVFFL